MLASLDPRGVIFENTAILSPRLVPEIDLHLAAEDRALYRAGEIELAEMGLGTPYWAFAWAGGQALARYILDNPKTVSGRKVLDFGSGSGLVAIAAAKANAFDVLASDIDPVAAEAMAVNRALNDVWFEITTEDVIGQAGDWEVILIGDAFYDKQLADSLTPWLRAERARGRTVLFGDPGRFYLNALGLQPIAAYHAETTGIMEDTDLRNARVWQL